MEKTSVTVREALDGIAAGTVATLAMSALMLAAGRAGLLDRQAPSEITERALERIGGREAPDAAVAPLTVLVHVGFGAAMGAAFTLLHRRVARGVPPAAAGIAFALGVWALSYKGWAPALGLMPPAERDRPGRPQTMIAAHIVYGAVLGALAGRRRAGR